MAAHRSRLRRSLDSAQLVAANAQLAEAFAKLSSVGSGWSNSAPYHAASDTRFRDFGNGLFGTRPRPEDQMLRPFDRARIISRGRLMFRNNPYLAALLLAYVQEFGTPTFRSTSRLADEKTSAAYNDARDRLLHDWALDCETDHALSLDQVVEIRNFEDCIAGEIFIVQLKDGTLQLIPSELCGSAPIAGPGFFSFGEFATTGTFQDGTPIPAGATECDGLVKDAAKNLIGYRFAQRALDALGLDEFKNSVVIPERYVFHLYDPDRCEMGRGVPRLAPILTRLQDVFETSDARNQQVKNAASLSMWITKNIDPYGFADAMRGSMRTGTFNAETLKTLADASSRSNYGEMRAGSIMYGAVGEDVKLIEPKLGSGDFHEHYIDLLQACAACLNGMPIEVGLEGFRASSYSSARATMEKWKRNLRRGRKRLEQKFLDPLALWQTNRAELFGDLQKIPRAQKTECRWGWPAIPEIDGLKTALQNAAELAIGATTLEKILADKNEFPDQVIAQFAREKGMFLKELIAQAIAQGFTADEARTWAMTQMPTGDGRALAAMITATGALGQDPPADKKPPVAA